MSRTLTFKVWCDSGDNIHSSHTDTVEIAEDEWLAMTLEEKVALMRDYAFALSDWGYEQVDPL
jgi:hypothetical protein